LEAMRIWTRMTKLKAGTKHGDFGVGGGGFVRLQGTRAASLRAYELRIDTKRKMGRGVRASHSCRIKSIKAFYPVARYASATFLHTSHHSHTMRRSIDIAYFPFHIFPSFVADL
jgi:hypothetical protein